MKVNRPDTSIMNMNQAQDQVVNVCTTQPEMYNRNYGPNYNRVPNSGSMNKGKIILIAILAFLIGAGIACAIAIPLTKHKYDDDDDNKGISQPIKDITEKTEKTEGMKDITEKTEKTEKIKETEKTEKTENALQEIIPYGDSSKTTYIFGHKTPDTDTISSALIVADLEKKLGNQNNLVACRLGDLNKETQYVLNYFKLDPPKLIDSVEGADSVILVDHNAYSQSVDDLASSKIAIDKVYDHHKIEGFSYDNPTEYNGLPLGSTCSVLYKKYKLYNFEIPKFVAGLTVSAILSDTSILHSSTTTDYDRKVVEEASKIAGIEDYEKYGGEMLKALTNYSDLTDEQVLDSDAKVYDSVVDSCKNVIKYKIGTASAYDINEFFKQRKSGLINAMNNQIQSDGYKIFVFFVVDIVNYDSYSLILGDQKEIAKNAFAKYECTELESESEVYYLKGVSSRKKDIVPPLDEKIKETCTTK